MNILSNVEIYRIYFWSVISSEVGINMVAFSYLLKNSYCFKFALALFPNNLLLFISQYTHRYIFCFYSIILFCRIIQHPAISFHSVLLLFSLFSFSYTVAAIVLFYEYCIIIRFLILLHPDITDSLTTP